jgi:hypothetical protein
VRFPPRVQGRRAGAERPVGSGLPVLAHGANQLAQRSTRFAAFAYTAPAPCNFTCGARSALMAPPDEPLMAISECGCHLLVCATTTTAWSSLARRPASSSRSALDFNEKPQVQALDRTQASLPMKPGRAGTVPHDYKRHGTVDLFGLQASRVCTQRRDLWVARRRVGCGIARRTTPSAAVDVGTTRSNKRGRSKAIASPRMFLLAQQPFVDPAPDMFLVTDSFFEAPLPHVDAKVNVEAPTGSIGRDDRRRQSRGAVRGSIFGSSREM